MSLKTVTDEFKSTQCWV